MKKRLSCFSNILGNLDLNISPTSSNKDSESNNDLISVLGSAEENKAPTLPESPKETEKESLNPGSIIAIVFIALGVIFLSLCGIVIFWSYKKAKNEH